MRTYIFTEVERKAALQFLHNKKRNDIINHIFADFDDKWRKLALDFRLLIALKRLRDEGY
jgi:hypothetical protein